MKITRVDPFTSKVLTLDLPITEEQYENWRAGALIQEAFPGLSSDLREFLLTGITPDSWERYVRPLSEGSEAQPEASS